LADALGNASQEITLFVLYSGTDSGRSRITL